MTSSKDSVLKKKGVPFFSLYKFSNLPDKILLLVGWIIAIVAGAAIPMLNINFGKIIDVFVSFHRSNKFHETTSHFGPNGTLYPENVTDINLQTTTYAPVDFKIPAFHHKSSIPPEIKEFNENSYSLAFSTLAIGFAYFFACYFFVACLSAAAMKQAYRIKLRFYESLLRQEISWFDSEAAGGFATRLTSQLKSIEDGMGEKTGFFLYMLSTSVASLLVALYYGWELTVVLLAVTPAHAVISSIISNIYARYARKESESSKESSLIEREVISMIKTVFAFGAEASEQERYDKSIEKSMSFGILCQIMMSMGLALVWMTNYFMYAVGVWYGTKLIIASRETGSDDYTPGKMIVVFWNVISIAYYSGKVGPYLEAFNLAKRGAAEVFQVIERESHIDSMSTSGAKPAIFTPKIQFQKVSFAYPSKPETCVLKNVSFEVDEGETVAVVGPDPSKSILVHLILRFYETDQGEVQFSDQSIKDLNIGWLRSKIGLVGREPVLFDGTVGDNIWLGDTTGSASKGDITEAAEASTADEFIRYLPSRYETIVGSTSGVLLNNNEKQRIAIARALVKKPEVLLLDEVTSALDDDETNILDEAILRAKKGRTTLIIADKITRVVEMAEKILVLDKGEIRESGTHEQLMKKRGLYRHLYVSGKSLSEDGVDGVTDQKVPLNVKTKDRLDSVVSIVDGRDSPRDRSLDRSSSISSPHHKYSTKRWLRFMQRDVVYLVIGALAATVFGLGVPFYAIIYGEYIVILEYLKIDDLVSDTGSIAVAFVELALIISISSFVASSMLGIASERLVTKIRSFAFGAVMSQELSWFDRNENSPENLQQKLSVESQKIKQLTSSRILSFFQSMGTLIACISFSFYINWQMGVIVLTLVPLILFRSYLSNQIAESDSKEEANSAKSVVEVVNSIKKVTCLQQQMHFYSVFDEVLMSELKRKQRDFHFRGQALGLAQSLPVLAYAVAFLFGSYFIQEKLLEPTDFFKIVEGVIFGSVLVSETSIFTSSFKEAENATAYLFHLIDSRQSASGDSGQTGHIPQETNGNLEFEDVDIRSQADPYPRLLKGLNLVIRGGQSVALVGRNSGAKSMLFYLMEKFYRPTHGTVMLDGDDITLINTAWLRKQIGLIAKEPQIFSYSIGENIAYGDKSRVVTSQEIQEASKKAGLHQFVRSLPIGYDTAADGFFLSDEQKQKISLARIIIRDPKILLLDDITSGMTADEETRINTIIDEIKKDKTCIYIPSKCSVNLSTFSKIAVLTRGSVAEVGTHIQLMDERNLYYKLYQSQN